MSQKEADLKNGLRFKTIIKLTAKRNCTEFFVSDASEHKVVQHSNHDF